jgi:hypothetical protein
MPSKKNKTTTSDSSATNGGLFSSNNEGPQISSVSSLFSKPAPVLKEQPIEQEEEEIKVNLEDKSKRRGGKHNQEDEDDEPESILPLEEDRRPDDGYKPYIDENQSAYANKVCMQPN